MTAALHRSLYVSHVVLHRDSAHVSSVVLFTGGDQYHPSSNINGGGEEGGGEGRGEGGGGDGGGEEGDGEDGPQPVR